MYGLGGPDIGALALVGLALALWCHTFWKRLISPWAVLYFLLWALLAFGVLTSGGPGF
ncbi:MAG: hypothetical protein WD872_13630 [Pirellulaceae bacterium]